MTEIAKFQIKMYVEFAHTFVYPNDVLTKQKGILRNMDSNVTVKTWRMGTLLVKRRIA